MIKVEFNGRKFIIKTQYGPAGVNRSSIRKAIKRLEKLANSDGLVSIESVKKILETAKPNHKKMMTVLVDSAGNFVDETSENAMKIDMPVRPKFTRRKTTISVFEETIDDGEVLLNEVLVESVVNDSNEAFTRDYGRSFGFKKAVRRMEKLGIISSEDVEYFEKAFKDTIPASAETLDKIDVDYIDRLLFSE